MIETIARVDSILPPVHGRYTDRVTVIFSRPREGEPSDEVGTVEGMSPMSFRGVFGVDAVVGAEYRVTTEPVESGA